MIVLELMFQEYEMSSLKQVFAHTSLGEQTADVIIPDSCADVDRIVDSFGTVTIQDSQCLQDSVSVSGLVQVGILFVGENEELNTVSARLPFSFRKDLPEIVEQGMLCYDCRVVSVDARALNSRKLLVRAGLQCSFRVFEREVRVLKELELPSEALQLRRTEYPMKVPTEFGEKSFTINDELELPGSAPAITRILKAVNRMQILEQKAVGGKGVFKMELLLHLLYADPQEQLCTYEWRIPLSQFVDLSGDTDNAELNTVLLLKEFDLEPDSQIESRRLFLRLGVAAQCMALEVRTVDLIEDAYCTDAILQPQWQQWQCRSLLDSQTIRGTAQWTGEEGAASVVDTWAYAEEGEKEAFEDQMKLRLPLHCSVLFYDTEGKLQGKQIRPVMEAELPLHRGASCELRDCLCTEVYCNANPRGMELRVPVQLTADSYGEQTLRSLDGGEVLPLPEASERQPSLILRRTEGEEELWNIAKAYRTPMKAIQQANDLSSTVVPEDTMLLIPL